jgi:glycolate oxidase FAD binding subunit
MGEGLAGLAALRQAARIDVPGALVEEVFAPTTPAEVAQVVAAAAAERAGLLVLGGCTRIDCARPARALGAGLSLEALSGIDTFEPDEGVLHAAAGTPIAEIRRVVAEEGWELPLDSPGPRSTVGGTIASAVTGPRAQAFGSVSDAILGLEVVGGDGMASKCGGRVVKNVTGYDLAKLYCGSFGTLAVVTGAWLRLRPQPAVREAYRARVAGDRASFESIRALARLTSVRALLWCEATGESSAEVFVELGGSEEGVRHDRSAFAERLSLETIPTAEIDRLRDARTAEAVEPDAVALRARVLGSKCESLRREICDMGLSVSADPGLGVVHARGRITLPSVLLGLRARAERAGGIVTFEVLPDAFRKEVDVFGSLDGTEALVQGLKARFDPAGILNPGRFVCDASGAAS